MESEDINNEMLDCLIELYESAVYWSEYDVPIGIVDRIKNIIEKATGKTIEEVLNEQRK
jgi:hypothetical protein